MLRRSADDTDNTDGIERPVVANADQLVIVTALADPPPRPRMIDRMLVAAFDADIEPMLCLTKSDLASPDELVSLYDPLGVPYVVVQKGGTLDEMRERLKGRISVLVGHSGVGKSTLVNALVPDANRAVSHVNAVTGRGRHTSTSAVALELPEGGWIIDTPGRAQLRPGPRLGGDRPRRLPRPHRGHHPVPQGLQPSQRGVRPGRLGGRAGHADPARLVSLRRLLASREGTPDDDRAVESQSPDSQVQTANETAGRTGLATSSRRLTAVAGWRLTRRMQTVNG